MSGVSYDGKKLIPAPYVNITKSYTNLESDIHVGATYNVTLLGKVFSDRGSPTSSGFWVLSGSPANETPSDSFATLLSKIEQIQQLFTRDGRLLEIKGCDGSTKIMFRPRVSEVSFPDGQWYDYTDYTVQLQCDEISGIHTNDDLVYGTGYFIIDGNKTYLKSASEEWSTEMTDQYQPIGVPVFRATRRVSAAGKKNWDASGNEISALTSAKRWVAAQSGIYTDFLHNSDGLNIPATYSLYNHSRSVSQSILGGTYSIDENWLVVSGVQGITEDYSISTQDSIDSALETLSIEGTIQGLDSVPRYVSGVYVTPVFTKYTNASGYFYQISSGAYSTIYQRTLAYSNTGWLNNTPRSTSVGRNPNAGTINYTYNFDSRPETTGLIPGCLSASIDFGYSLPVDVFGSVPIPGRLAGPILQPLDMKSERKTSCSIDVYMPPFTGMWTTISGIMANPAFTPVNTFCTGIYEYIRSLSAIGANSVRKILVENDGDTWNPIDRHYTRNITWTYELANGINHVG